DVVTGARLQPRTGGAAVDRRCVELVGRLGVPGPEPRLEQVGPATGGVRVRGRGPGVVRRRGLERRAGVGGLRRVGVWRRGDGAREPSAAVAVLAVTLATVSVLGVVLAARGLGA